MVILIIMAPDKALFFSTAKFFSYFYTKILWVLIRSASLRHCLWLLATLLRNIIMVDTITYLESCNHSFIYFCFIRQRKATELVEIRHRLVPTNTVDIVDYDDLRHQCQELCPTDTEFSLVLQQVCENKQAVIQESENNIKVHATCQVKQGSQLQISRGFPYNFSFFSK